MVAREEMVLGKVLLFRTIWTSGVAVSLAYLKCLYCRLKVGISKQGKVKVLLAFVDCIGCILVFIDVHRFSVVFARFVIGETISLCDIKSRWAASRS